MVRRKRAAAKTDNLCIIIYAREAFNKHCQNALTDTTWSTGLIQDGLLIALFSQSFIFFLLCKLKKKIECNDPGHVMVSVGGPPVADDSFAKTHGLRSFCQCSLFF